MAFRCDGGSSFRWWPRLRFWRSRPRLRRSRSSSSRREPRRSGRCRTCADGSTAPGTLLVSTTRAFSAPDTEDPTPTARLQFLAVCPGGISFSWGAPAVPATITSDRRLRHLTATGSGVARDIFSVSHPVTFDVAWRKAGPLEKTVNAPGSITKVRVATADGVATFDGAVLFDGPSNHPTRPAPFIRIDIEK